MAIIRIAVETVGAIIEIVTGVTHAVRVTVMTGRAIRVPRLIKIRQTHRTPKVTREGGSAAPR